MLAIGKNGALTLFDWQGKITHLLSSPIECYACRKTSRLHDLYNRLFCTRCVHKHLLGRTGEENLAFVRRLTKKKPFEQLLEITEA